MHHINRNENTTVIYSQSLYLTKTMHPCIPFKCHTWGLLIRVNKLIFNFYSDICSLVVGSFSLWLNLFSRNYFFFSNPYPGKAAPSSFALPGTRKQRTHGRFIRQSQIGIWSIVIASSLVWKLLCDGFKICETFLKYHQAQTFRSALGRFFFLFSTFLCARIAEKASAADTKEQKLRRLSFYLRLFSSDPLTPTPKMWGPLYGSARVLIGDLENMTVRLGSHLCAVLVFSQRRALGRKMWWDYIIAY